MAKAIAPDSLFQDGTEADHLNGSERHDTLSGHDGDDTLEGASGNDRLDGGAGNDRMIGGSGDDTYLVSEVGDIVVEVAGGGRDMVIASVSHTLAAWVEDLQLTGSANLKGTGNDLANRIIGNDGNNVIDGRAGADRMEGGKSNDTYLVDNSADVIVEAINEGFDWARASVSYALADHVDGLVLTGAASTSGTGTAASNRMDGNSGANALSGLGGNDKINGAGGADTLDGGAGSDVLLRPRVR